MISEGNSSREMLKTVLRVMGKKAAPGLAALVIRSDLGARTLQSKINRLIKTLNADKGILILTELYGSTQSNVCADFIQKGQIEMISGYNLPLVLKAITLNKTATLAQVSRQACLAGKKYIKLFR